MNIEYLWNKKKKNIYLWWISSSKTQKETVDLWHNVSRLNIYINMSDVWGLKWDKACGGTPSWSAAGEKNYIEISHITCSVSSSRFFIVYRLWSVLRLLGSFLFFVDWVTWIQQDIRCYTNYVTNFPTLHRIEHKRQKSASESASASSL